MKFFSRFFIFLLLLIDFSLAIWVLTRGKLFAMFQPMGIIAEQERTLFLTVVLLAMLIVIPVFIFAIVIVLKYRDGNTKAAYSPDWDQNTPLQVAWWGILGLLIVVLGVITIKSTHKLDPFKPIESATKPLTIQVVALQWKWLFIYPEQNIATINYIAFPEKTPITFELTADAPMNSFWIPQLGGQMYAMAGMVNRTHLMASRTGKFQGSDAEISGAGFAGMRFIAEAKTSDDFSTWVQTVKDGSQPLTTSIYSSLAKPSEDTKPVFYAPVEKGLYNGVIMKFMAPNKTQSEKSMPGMSM